MKPASILFLGAFAVLQAAESNCFADAASRAAMAAVQKRFDEMDANGDGKIDRAEYLEYERKKANERFDVADENSDGFIARKEAERAMKKKEEEMRQKMKEWREKRSELRQME
jgi:Ca2+-binding EF-hand superfamily protein